MRIILLIIVLLFSGCTPYQQSQEDAALELLDTQLDAKGWTWEKTTHAQGFAQKGR